jgi:hypothetical protein
MYTKELVAIGRKDLLIPTIRDEEIEIQLSAVACSKPRICAALDKLKPRSYARYLRRHRRFLRTLLADT